MTTTNKSQLQKIREIATPDQIFCLVLTICLCGYFPVIFSNWQSYTRFRKLERPDYTHQTVEDFYMVIPYAIVLRILKFSTENYTYSYFKEKLTKYQGEELERKIRKCARGVFKIFNFTFIFIFGWIFVLRDTKFWPPIMLGEGELMTVFSDWPYTEMPKFLKFYYIWSLSYYLEDLVFHLFQSPNSDYFEMILHHIITAMLIFSSYFNGFWNIGIFVLMQMDVADIFIGWIRIILDYANKWYIFAVYVCIMVSFFHFRLIAYTYWVLWKFGLGGRLSVDNFTHIVSVIDFLLLGLLGLNIYWFVLLTKMGLRFAFSSKWHDLQNVVTKKDIQMNHN